MSEIPNLINRQSLAVGLSPEALWLTQSFIISALAGCNVDMPEMLAEPLPSGILLVGEGGCMRMLENVILPLEQFDRGSIVRSREFDSEYLESKYFKNAHGQSCQLLEQAREGVDTFRSRLESRDYLEHLLRPLTLVRFDSGPSIRQLIDQSHQGSPIVADAHGAALSSLLSKRVRKSDVDTMNFLISGMRAVTGVFSTQSKARKTSVEHRRLAYIGCVSEATYESLIDSDREEIRDFLDLCIVCKPSVVDVEDIPSREDVVKWHRLYRGAIDRAVTLRRGLGEGVGLDDSAFGHLLKAERELMGTCDARSSLLPRMLLFGSALFVPEWAKQLGLVKRSISVGRQIAEQHCKLLERPDRELCEKKAKLLKFIREEAPCRWSKVARHLTNQRKAANTDAINSLISEGLIEVDDGGYFRSRSVA